MKINPTDTNRLAISCFNRIMDVFMNKPEELIHELKDDYDGVKIFTDPTFLESVNMGRETILKFMGLNSVDAYVDALIFIMDRMVPDDSGSLHIISFIDSVNDKHADAAHAEASCVSNWNELNMNISSILEAFEDYDKHPKINGELIGEAARLGWGIVLMSSGYSISKTYKNRNINLQMVYDDFSFKLNLTASEDMSRSEMKNHIHDCNKSMDLVTSLNRSLLAAMSS